jgi:hypothetical protein
MRNMSDHERAQAHSVIRKLFGGTPYTFHREGGFYPLALGSDEEAVANAKCNPGTLKVVNELTGQTVFEKANQ